MRGVRKRKEEDGREVDKDREREGERDIDFVRLSLNDRKAERMGVTLRCIVIVTMIFQ